MFSCAQWLVPIFLALRRQEDCYQFEAYKEMKFSRDFGKKMILEI